MNVAQFGQLASLARKKSELFTFDGAEATVCSTNAGAAPRTSGPLVDTENTYWSGPCGTPPCDARLSSMYPTLSAPVFGFAAAHGNHWSSSWFVLTSTWFGHET